MHFYSSQGSFHAESLSSFNYCYAHQHHQTVSIRCSTATSKFGDQMSHFFQYFKYSDHDIQIEEKCESSDEAYLTGEYDLLMESNFDACISCPAS